MPVDDRRRPVPAVDYLRRDEDAAALWPTAERLLRMDGDLRPLLPAALRASVVLAAADDATVVVHAMSAGAAAKLRQTLPRLVAGLSARGWRVDAIRVRVVPSRAGERSAPSHAPRHAPMSTAGVAAFAALGGGLEESPLKTAVARLVARRAG